MPDEIPISVVFSLPEDRAFTYWAPQVAQPGCRVLAPLRGRQAEGVVLETPTALPDGVKVKPVNRVLDTETLFGTHTLELARWIARYCLCSLGEALLAMLPGGRREAEPPAWEEPESWHEVAKLSPEQVEAVHKVLKEEGPWFYLRGQTGSGKTEVYLRLAQEMVDRDKTVLFLVPEISLTHQIADEARRRFGEPAILHSALTPSQRLKEWRRIQKKETRLILGARSAIFAPAFDLGLIILDEEPETGYKSGAVPRYHARSAAMALSGMTGARLLMGSATPSLEALEEIRRGRLTELKLSRRLSGGAPPRVSLVDTRGEEGLVSVALAEAVLRTASEGLQSVILLNRRGFTYLYHCLQCHYEQHCPSCSAPMTFHKHRTLMVCHHCGRTQKQPQRCPQCGSHDVGWGGVGTEMAEEEMARVFPKLSRARLDADTAADRKKAGKILRDFAEGRFQLLLGTQMIAKGLNFPLLKTVGILNADIGLSLPDFRSAERVYNLIRQTTGRAGRYRPDGEVFLQTWRPESWIMKAAAAGDDEGFQAKERQVRLQLGLPPFQRLLRVVVRHRDAEAAKCDAVVALQAARSAAGKEVVFLGPAECAMEKVADWYRRHFLAKAASAGPLLELGRVLRSFKAPQRSRVELDMDPVNLR